MQSGCQSPVTVWNDPASRRPIPSNAFTFHLPYCRDCVELHLSASDAPASSPRAPIHSIRDPVSGEKPTVFTCADDKAAHSTVIALAKEIGFEVVDAGHLDASRNIENLGLGSVAPSNRLRLTPSHTDVCESSA